MFLPELEMVLRCYKNLCLDMPGYSMPSPEDGESDSRVKALFSLLSPFPYSTHIFRSSEEPYMISDGISNCHHLPITGTFLQLKFRLLQEVGPCLTLSQLCCTRCV